MFALPPLLALAALGAPLGGRGVEFSVPTDLPTAPTTCEYEGVFPGSGVQGRWTLRTRDGGEWEVTPASPDLLKGVVERHVGARPFVVVEGILRGTETRTGVITRSQERLDATVDVEGQRATVSEIMDRELACPGTPRKVEVGDTWKCMESSTLTTQGQGPIQRPEGSVHNRGEETWTRLDDEVGADGKALVVLEVRSEDRHERMALDPADPWCPVRTERLVAGRVVGTDRRVAEAKRPDIRLPGREGGNITLPRFGMMLLVGALMILGLAFGVSWIAGRRNSRRREC